MNQETVVRMRILSSTDAPSVSTILEEMFQFFDGRVRCRGNYKTIKKHVRLRLALMVFGDSGYARLDETMKPKPMVVPTTKLLTLLKLRNLTTDVEPLALLPVQHCISQPETGQLQYTRAFKSAMANEMANFLYVPAAMLNMWEIESLHHSRASTGELVWSVTSTGVLTFSGQAGSNEDAIEAHMTKHSVTGMASTSPSASLLLRGTRKAPRVDAGQAQDGQRDCLGVRLLRTPRPNGGAAIMKGLELEFEIDSENILLLREDQLPLSREILQLLEISHTELQHLFKSAAMLLAETNSVDRMRCYVARDSCGEWQVKLLSP
jgi:hypothetical protein